MQMQKPSVRLEDWAVVPTQNTANYQELRPGYLLVGRAFGHLRIKKGMFIFTSPIVLVDRENKIVETRKTAYCLGEASLEYTAWKQHQRSRNAA